MRVCTGRREGEKPHRVSDATATFIYPFILAFTLLRDGERGRLKVLKYPQMWHSRATDTSFTSPSCWEFRCVCTGSWHVSHAVGAGIQIVFDHVRWDSLSHLLQASPVGFSCTVICFWSLPHSWGGIAEVLFQRLWIKAMY